MYLLPGTAETLSLVLTRDITTALITNGDSVGQRAKIARFGLEKLFRLILIEEELGFGKPDERIFREGLRRVGANPDRTLMVGDNLVWDIQGAQAVGIRGVWFNWRRTELPPDAPAQPFTAITELRHLMPVLEHA